MCGFCEVCQWWLCIALQVCYRWQQICNRRQQMRELSQLIIVLLEKRLHVSANLTLFNRRLLLFPLYCLLHAADWECSESPKFLLKLKSKNNILSNLLFVLFRNCTFLIHSYLEVQASFMKPCYSSVQSDHQSIWRVKCSTVAPLTTLPITYLHGWTNLIQSNFLFFFHILKLNRKHGD